jgi:hypothetical protein
MEDELFVLNLSPMMNKKAITMPRLKDQVCDLHDGFPIYAGLSCHRQIARAVSTGPAKLAKFGAA